MDISIELFEIRWIHACPNDKLNCVNSTVKRHHYNHLLTLKNIKDDFVRPYKGIHLSKMMLEIVKQQDHFKV